jgi:hypothetical protein
MRPRFSILGLMAVVLLTAALGTLINRSPVLLGFMLFGWASLFLAFGPMQNATPVPRPLSTLAHLLLSLVAALGGGVVANLLAVHREAVGPLDRGDRP